jgi:hypothetical protein
MLKGSDPRIVYTVKRLGKRFYKIWGVPTEDLQIAWQEPGQRSVSPPIA